jgi:DNA primase
MGIVNDDVDRVRQEADIVAVIGDHVALKRVGRRLVGLCPFHAEKTPSFSVSPELQSFHCFGCGQGGDVIHFVREIDGLGFVEAIERLAARFSIPLRYDDANQGKERQRRDRLVAVNEAAIDFYHRLLLDDAAARPAREHLRARGFLGDAARRFRLGYAPEGWDRLSHHLQQQRFSRQDIVDAGLAFVNKANKLQDQFRHRLVFPIFDAKGDALGFGGRTLTGEGPKYRNTQETPLYHKSHVLYGLNWARAEIVARGEVIVCEGYTDVMAFHLAGVPRAVATCGTALADEHFRTLKNLARTIVIAYDADAAGQAAAEKFYRWEQQFEVRLKVAALPIGRDPAEVWQQSPEAVVDAVAQSRPFLEFRVLRALGAADRDDTAEGRATAAMAAVAVIAEIPDDGRGRLLRDQYLVVVHERTGIAIDRLRETLASTGRGGGRSAPVAFDETARGPERVVDRVEEEALRAAVHHPELVADRLEPWLFADPDCIEVLDALYSTATITEALENVSPEVQPLLRRIAMVEPRIDLETAPVHDDEGEARPAGPAAEARQELRRKQRMNVEHDKAIEHWISRCLTGLVEAATRRALRRSDDPADRTSREISQTLQRLRLARQEGDWASANRLSEGLVDLLRALEDRSD